MGLSLLWGMCRRIVVYSVHDTLNRVSVRNKLCLYLADFLPVGSRLVLFSCLLMTKGDLLLADEEGSGIVYIERSKRFI